MAFFKEFGKKAQVAAVAAAEKAKETTEMAKISLAITSEEREMDKQYRAIGQWFVDHYEGEISDDVRVYVEAVIKSRAKVEELELSKNSRHATKEASAPTCGVCGAHTDSKFCPQCGAPMEQ